MHVKQLNRMRFNFSAFVSIDIQRLNASNLLRWFSIVSLCIAWCTDLFFLRQKYVAGVVEHCVILPVHNSNTSKQANKQSNTRTQMCTQLRSMIHIKEQRAQCKCDTSVNSYSAQT